MGSNNPASSLDRPDTWKNTGNEYFHKRDYESAIKCYTHAIEINPIYIDAWNNLGYALLKAGKIDEAKQVNKRVKELKSKVNSNVQPYWGSHLGTTFHSIRSIVVAFLIWAVITFLFTAIVVWITGETSLAPLFAMIFGLMVFFGIVFYRIVFS